MTWRCGFLFVWMVYMTAWVHAQIRPVDSFKQTISALREQDDLESVTYAFIDEYLKHPTEANLLLFDAYEKERWRSWIKKEEYLAYVILLCNQGYYLTQYGNVQESILAYEKASRLFNEQRLTDFDIIEYCLKPLGNNYSMLGDYKSAVNIVKDYLYLAEQQHNHAQLVAAYINLSVIDHDTGHYKEAILLLQQALTVTQLTAEKKLLIHYNLARNYAALHEFAKARHYADQVIALCAFHRSADTVPTLVNVYTLLSITALSDHQAVQALSFIMKAHSMAWSNAGLFKTRELAKINNTYAGVLLASGHYKDALKNYQRSLMLLLPQYDAAKNELPEASMFYAENTIKETLDGMADAYTRLGQPNQALACYMLRFDAEDLLRETYNYEEAKLQQQTENRNVTEQAIELLYALSEKKNDSRYAVKAFQFAERTKAMILREQIEDRYWRKLVAQDTLIKKENTLRYKQALLASEISSEQMKQQQANVEYIRERTGQQTSIAMELKAVATALEKKYPGRKRDVFFMPEEVTDLQRTLKKDNATLVEFFFGKRAVYMFRVDDQSITMTKTDSVDRLKQNILALHDLFTNAEAIHHQVERYKDLAFDLSQSLHLTEPMASPNLVLVPDGLLHLVPFDALLYEKKPGINYQDFSWLLKRYTISYQSSASLYTRSSVALVPLDHQENVLGIFPMFPDSPRQLDYSEKEAHDIRDQMEGLFLINKQATRHAFLEQANQFPIIHLSTHASAGTDVEPPSIQFIDSTLYLPSIYGLHLNADLLVLSACETGKGVMVKGEGAMSLAHGFQFAGVRNIIFSLWKVNDYATAVLMNNFYNQYRAQGSKAEGLQMAKLDYLKDETVSNARKSPYYWAGFVYYGSLEKQPVTKAWPRLAMACAIGGMVLFIFIAIKRSKKKSY